VIVVIAILMAFLLPVFSKAKARSNEVVCASNLRQLGLAFEQYSADNNEHYPLPGSGDGHDAKQNGPFWDLGDPSNGGPINAYIKQRSSQAEPGPSIWFCPSMPKYIQTPNQISSSTITYDQLTERTYVMNWYLRDPSPNPDDGGKIVDPEVTFADLDPATAFKLFDHMGDMNRSLTLSRLVSPSDTVLLFEGVPVSGTNSFGPYFGSPRRSGDFSFEKGYMPSTATSLDVYEAEGIITPCWTPSIPWHNGFNNYLFCDGHVKAQRPKPYPWVPTPQDNQWYVARYR